MQRFNRRFPGVRGFLRLTVQDTDDTFRIFRELADDHAERAAQLRDYYLGNAVPVSMIAHLTGRHVDTSKNRVVGRPERRLGVVAGAGAAGGAAAGPARSPLALRPVRVASRTRPGGACW